MNENSFQTINEKLDLQKNLTAGQEKNLSSTPKSSTPLSKPIKNGLPILKPLCEIWDNLKTDIMSRELTPKHKIGLPSIDNTLWGLHKQELVVIGARTSHGKSSFAINTVKNLADTNLRIIYFSLEMSKEQVLEKLLCNFCEINNRDLKQGMSKSEVIKNEKTFLSWISEIKLLIDDKYGYDFDSLVKVCEIIKPDFIFLDYIQMVSSKGYRSKVEAIEEYVRKIKELSVTMNFGAIIVSQINRSGVDDPTMSKFKWAGVLEEHPDVCIVLSYDKVKGAYKVNIEKQRNGETKEIFVNFEPQYSRFADLTEQQLQEKADAVIRREENKNSKFRGLHSKSEASQW